MRSRSPSLAFAACFALALVSAACAEPLQNGGVVIVGDPAARLGTLCRFRHSTEGSVCASETAEVKPAKAHPIAGPEEGLRGPFATGRPGDYVLENEEIAVVIEAPGSANGDADTGGHLVDAGDARTRIDALGLLQTTMGGSVGAAIYDSITSGAAKDGTAFVEVVGRARSSASIRLKTRYELAPGSRAVSITTTLVSSAPDPITVDLGEVVRWGGAAEGSSAAQGPSAIATPYLLGVGTGVAYALVPNGSSLDGAEGAGPASILARASAGGTSAIEVRGATLAPSKPESYQRALVVTTRGDTAAIATELLYLTGGSPGAAEITPSWEGKAFLRPNENRILLRRSCATCPPASLPDPPSLWIAQPSEGPAAAELPPGKYAARFEGPGGSSPEVSFEVTAGAATKVSLPIAPGGLLRARVIEAEPLALAAALEQEAKGGARAVHVSALAGKPTPAKIQVLDASSGARVGVPSITVDGRAEIALPAGKYKVIASRGPERTIDEATVEIAKGAEADVDLAIARVVDTTGYVACDVGARTAKSLESPVTLGARLRASAAEGVECAVLDERDPSFDPAPAVEALELGAHLRAFTQAAVFGRAAGASDEGSRGVETLALWTGRAAPSGDHGLDPLWSALSAKRRPAPIGVAFTSADPAREPGYPRTYIAAPAEDPSKLALGDLSAGLANRNVVLTNGPFVTVRVGDVAMGGTAPAGPKRRATIAVHVERPSWVDASELTVMVGGSAALTVPLSGAKKSEHGALVDDIAIPLVFGKAPLAKSPSGAPTVYAPEDTTLVAIVRGARSLEPVLGGDPATIKPFAVTSPIWLRAAQ